MPIFLPTNKYTSMWTTIICKHTGHIVHIGFVGEIKSLVVYFSVCFFGRNVWFRHTLVIYTSIPNTIFSQSINLSQHHIIMVLVNSLKILINTWSVLLSSATSFHQNPGKVSLLNSFLSNLNNLQHKQVFTFFFLLCIFNLNQPLSFLLTVSFILTLASQR